MSTTQVRVVVACLFFVFIFLFGFLVTRAGKPYPTLLFTIHKLTAVGAVVWMGITIAKISQAAPLSHVQVLAIAATGVLFALMIITGGVISGVKQVPGIIAAAHHYLPYLTVLSSAWMIYLVILKGGAAAA